MKSSCHHASTICWNYSCCEQYESFCWPTRSLNHLQEPWPGPLNCSRTYRVLFPTSPTLSVFSPFTLAQSAVSIFPTIISLVWVTLEPLSFVLPIFLVWFALSSLIWRPLPSNSQALSSSLSCYLRIPFAVSVQIPSSLFHNVVDTSCAPHVPFWGPILRFDASTLSQNRGWI